MTLIQPPEELNEITILLLPLGKTPAWLFEIFCTHKNYARHSLLHSYLLENGDQAIVQSGFPKHSATKMMTESTQKQADSLTSCSLL